MFSFQNRRLFLSLIGLLVLLVILMLRWNLPRPLTGQLLISMSFSDLNLGGLYTFDLNDRTYQRRMTGLINGLYSQTRLRQRPSTTTQFSARISGIWPFNPSAMTNP